MDVTTIPAAPRARHRKKRVGRGIGSGHGKTSTRGQKGQRSRTGEGKRPGFEGGRNPLIRRLPKRGGRDKTSGHVRPREVVNVESLNRFEPDAQVTPEQLRARGLIRYEGGIVKLLGDGTLTKKLRVQVHAASASAKEKVQQAGGAVELIGTTASAEGSRLKAEGKRREPPASGLQS